MGKIESDDSEMREEKRCHWKWIRQSVRFLELSKITSLPGQRVHGWRISVMVVDPWSRHFNQTPANVLAMGSDGLEGCVFLAIC
jgi:hypothetical protein